jgi:hypothetical protein
LASEQTISINIHRMVTGAKSLCATESMGAEVPCDRNLTLRIRMKPKNAFIFTAATALGVLLALSLIAPRPALAQGGANTGLSGTVSDPTGLPIPGATVTITRVDTGEQ